MQLTDSGTKTVRIMRRSRFWRWCRMPKAFIGHYRIMRRTSGVVRSISVAWMLVRLMMGVITINEARQLENLPGIGPSGNVRYVPHLYST